MRKHHGMTFGRKRNSLSIALALCLSGPINAFASATDIGVGSHFAEANLPVITTIERIERQLAHNQALVGLKGLQSIASVQAAIGTSSATRASDRLVAVVDAGALAQPMASSQAQQLAEAGVPVLVLRKPGVLLTPQGRADESQLIAQTFGFASDGDAAYYRKRGDGVMTATSATRPMGNDRHAFAATMNKVHEELELHLHADTPQPGSAPMANMLQERAHSKGIEANRTHSIRGYRGPFLELSDTRVDRRGSRIQIDAVALRDTAPSRDRFVIATTTTASILPLYTYGGRPLTEAFPGESDSTRLLWYRNAAPVSYIVRQSAELRDNHGVPYRAQPTLISQYPESTGATDVTFGQTQSASTTYSVGMNSSLGLSLSDAGVPSPEFKVGFDTSLTEARTTESSIHMVLRDYSVAASAPAGPSRQDSRWSFNLTPGIRDQPYRAGTQPTRTPMMDQASFNVYALWSIPANRHQSVVLTAGASTDMRGIAFLGQGRGQSALVTAIQGEAQYPSPTVTVDLESPFLTPTPTTQLRSLSGNGRCLAQASGTNDVVTAACNRNNRRSLWRLDSRSRYVNLGSGQCLTLVSASSSVTMSPCAEGRLDQEWQWQADRIHSRLDGASTGWRLIVNRAQNRAAAGNHRSLGELPVNADHTLLSPWSSYPGAPIAGDFIPVLNSQGVRPQIPRDWIRLYKAPADLERWDVIPFRTTP